MVRLLAPLACLALALPALGTPVLPDTSTTWAHPDSTTHTYEVILVEDGVTWADARFAARSAGGYLATITSEQEGAVVLGLIDDARYWYAPPSPAGALAGPWIGLVRAPDSTGTPNWSWVTDEALAFQDWRAGQPSANLRYTAGHLVKKTDGSVQGWNALDPYFPNLVAYVVEYDERPLPDPEERTVGLVRRDSAASEGYTLFSPLLGKTTYLIDNDGREVHRWEADYRPGVSAYILPEGWLLRTASLRGIAQTRFADAGGLGGRIEALEWDGRVIWSYELANDDRHLHHDIEPLYVEKRVLALAWEYHSPEEARAAGRDTTRIPEGGVWSEVIMELKPRPQSGASVVWEWRVWDHLVQDFDSTKANYAPSVADEPGRIDINYGNEGEDWLHINAIAYDPVHDQVAFSVQSFSEVWVVDHSTTTAEAADTTGGQYGKGGDLLYRWGNPAAYKRGGLEAQTLFRQHDPQFIPTGRPGAGNLLIFNNGPGRIGDDYASVDEVVLPRLADGSFPDPEPGEPWGPEAPVWTYTLPEPTDTYASYISGVQRLLNGNTLYCDGPNGAFGEVDSSGVEVWRYVTPTARNGRVLGTHEAIPVLPNGIGTPLPPETDVPSPGFENLVFRVTRYAPDYAGFAGRLLHAEDPIEGYPQPLPVAQRVASPMPAAARAVTERGGLSAAPNPTRGRATLRFSLGADGPVRLTVYDALGREVARLADGPMVAGTHAATFEAQQLPAGVYLVRLQAGDRVETQRLTLIR